MKTLSLLLVLLMSISLGQKLKVKTNAVGVRWTFAKSCNSPVCGCWGEGCWQETQACFSLDCYLWQCSGNNCGCPSEFCWSGKGFKMITPVDQGGNKRFAWTDESRNK